MTSSAFIVMFGVCLIVYIKAWRDRRHLMDTSWWFYRYWFSSKFPHNINVKTPGGGFIFSTFNKESLFVSPQASSENVI